MATGLSRLASDGQDVAVVEQAIEDGGGDDGVAKDVAPLADAPIVGEEDRASFVLSGYELEEEMGGVFLEGQVSDLVDDQDLGLRVERVGRRSRGGAAGRRARRARSAQRDGRRSCHGCGRRRPRGSIG